MMSAGKVVTNETGPSAGKITTGEAQNIHMTGDVNPDSLEGLNKISDKCDVNFKQLLEGFRSSVPKFSGDIRKDYMSARSWIRLIVLWRRESLGDIEDLLFVSEIRRLLSGTAQKAMESTKFIQPAEILRKIQRRFPHLRFQRELVKLIDSGEAFTDGNAFEIVARLEDYTAELDDSPFGMMVIADAIQKLFPIYWEFLDLPTDNITSTGPIACTEEISRRLHRDSEDKATPYCKILSKAKPNKGLAIDTANTTSKSANRSRKNSRRRARNKAKLDQVLDLILQQNSAVSESKEGASSLSPKERD